MKKLNRNTKGQESELRQCYVYEIRIDGVVRYIGKGRNGRIYSHLIDAKRTASRPDVKICNLSPHFRKMLVSAVRRGLIIAENMVASNLTDSEAYAIEQEMIGNYHKQYAGQLWNTIDERLAAGHTDMRKGFDGLALMVQETLRRDPHGGHLFVFRGRRGGLIKVLWHDGQGLCLFSKRLERGRFLWPSPADGVVTITPAQLGYLLEGIDWRMPQYTWRPQAAG